jgi:hypothetical protein
MQVISNTTPAASPIPGIQHKKLEFGPNQTVIIPGPCPAPDREFR